MADLTITAANVLKHTGATVAKFTAGATITAGQPFYLDAADGGKAKPATANGTADQAAVAGVALHAALDEQPLQGITTGPYHPGATVALGTMYCLSGSGLICPVADLTSGDHVTYLGHASTTSELTLRINNTGVTYP